MKSMMKRTTLREIRQSFGRWFAIFAIVALGVGFFVGLKITKSAMLATEYEYLKEQNMFDVRLLSTLGFTNQDVEEIKKAEGVATAKGGYEIDILCDSGQDSEYVLKAHSITEGINTPALQSGRMPEKENECVVDSVLMGEDNISGASIQIGDSIFVSDNNSEDTLELLKGREFVVTGVVDSPYYMNFERGTTSIGNGRVAGYFYLPEEAFDSEYFTQILVKGEMDEKCYSDAYNEAADELKNTLDLCTSERVNLRYQEIKDEAQKEIDEAKAELAKEELKAQEELAEAKQELDDGKVKLEDGEAQLKDGEEQIEKARKELSAKKSELAETERSLQEALAQCPYEFLPQYAQIQQGLSQVEAGKAQIASAESTLNKNEQELQEKKQELEEANQKYQDGLQEYQEAEAEFQEKIAEAKEKLEDAQQEIDTLEEPDYYVLGRNTNIGYACFESDSEIVNGIANVFPIFFFLVAALVCMTTMNRMVEEQRTQIGVLKALGYGSGKIMSKYLFYSGSAAALGGIIGFFVGSALFPAVIWEAYGMMYTMPGIVLVFSWKYAVFSILVALVCSMGTTFITCKYELWENPASLIRPKPAKNGKRILLEYIPFIWKSMKFLHKVSIRNIFRYKQRFLMMVVGISGCTALLVTGFGVRDSIINIAGEQYEKIQIFDATVTLEDDMKEGQVIQLLEEGKEQMEQAALAVETTVDMEVGNKVKSVSMVSMDQTQDLKEFLSLHTKEGEEISYPGKGEAVITDKLSKRYDISVGDKIVLTSEDMEPMEVTVSGVCENFIYNYVYISNETYEEIQGETVNVNTVYVNIKEGIDIHEAAAAISDLEYVTSVSVNVDAKERFANMMFSLNYVIILVVVSAGLLAFIVLYNLTNINVTERIREIATIKVLGFYPGETASYVFRENIILTAVGALVGLLLGKYLHAFVMANIDIDMVSFHVQILPFSYLASFLLTFLFAGIVNLAMYFKLENINMAEALKSVE